MYPLIDVTEQKFNRLTAHWPVGSDKSHNVYWLCSCDCGNLNVVAVGALRFGKTQSCGCKNLERITKHGLASKKSKYRYLYQTWWQHLNWILNKESKSHAYYKNMPIESEWDTRICGDAAYPNFYNYMLFSSDMEKRPDKSYSLDIIDHTKGFVKGNLRWADKKTQIKNRRKYGRMITLSEFSDKELKEEYFKRFGVN